MPTVLRSLLLCALATPLAARGADAARPPDPHRGERLFVGSTRLAGGGAPCLACHGIAGHGLARAASFGPDLTAADAQYGADGLDGLLADIVFPSMQPVYRGHAVTPEERADLVAFLGAVGPGSPSRLGPAFGAGVAGAMAVFLGAILALGRRRTGRRARAAGGTP